MIHLLWNADGIYYLLTLWNWKRASDWTCEECVESFSLMNVFVSNYPGLILSLEVGFECDLKPISSTSFCFSSFPVYLETRSARSSAKICQWISRVLEETSSKENQNSRKGARGDVFRWVRAISSGLKRSLLGKEKSVCWWFLYDTQISFFPIPSMIFLIILW